MLRRWISASDAAPMPTFTTRPRIESRRPSRWRRVRTFESLTLRMSRVSGVTRHAAVTHAEHGALEVLKALAVPFNDAHAHAHGVSGPDLGQIGLQLLSGKRVQEVVHRNG